MNIGVLGTGDVGKAIGKGFITLGHSVKMGAREPGNPKAEAWAKEMGNKASAGTFADAAEFGEVVVLATLGVKTLDAIRTAGTNKFKGKLVFDTTNPLDNANGPPRLAVGHTDSGGEQIQRLIPDAHVVKAFNIVGNVHMFKPNFPGGPPDMLIAGNDDGAKKSATKILEDFGWEVVDLGGIEASRYLEPMCMAWVAYGMRTKTFNHAFKLLRK